MSRQAIVETLIEHGKTISGGRWRKWQCVCGAPLPTNSRLALAVHQQEMISAALSTIVRADEDEELAKRGANSEQTMAVRGWLKTKDLWRGPTYNGEGDES